MIKSGKIAVIGDRDCVLAFMSAGVETYGASNGEEANVILRKMTKDGDYAVIFITEDIAVQIPETLSVLKKQTYPAVIPIPSSQGSNGFGMAGIKKDVEKAVGADVLFNKD
ncbi:MAG: V-type ATP synthase subunit F [Clostridia bacterium]|nr:V-type ATP synthase subunit F [Clostridia bacterium]